MRRHHPVVLALVAGLALVAAACGTPPSSTPGPIPSCPSRQLVQLDPPSTTDYRIVRAVSATGAWAVVSRSVGSSWELSIRRTEPGAHPTVVGNVTDVDTTQTREPEVSVSPDGSSVLFQANQQPTADLFRWTLATGTTQVVPPPLATDPVTATTLTSAPRLSTDGRRILWVAIYQDTPLHYRSILTTTDASTDVVLSQHDLDGFWYGGGISSGGHQIGLLDVDAGTLAPVPDADAAIAAQFPGSEVGPSLSSDDGRYLTFEGGGATTPPRYDLLVWDRTTATARPVVIDSGRGPWVTALSDAGAVLWSSVSPTTGEADLLVSGTDGINRTIGRNAAPTFGSSFTTTWSRASTDLRTVVFTEDTGLTGLRLVASRCN